MTDLVVRVPILLQFNQRFTFGFTVEIIHQYCLLFGADSIDVILTVCLGEHGNMRSATYIHPYVDGDGKSLLMCTEDMQTFPPIETPAIPPPAMPAIPQLVDQISNNRCVSLVELTHGLFSISLSVCTFLHVMLSSAIHTSNGELQKISSIGRILHSSRRVQFLQKYLSSDAVDAKYHMSIIVSLLLRVLANIMTESLPIASGDATNTQDTVLDSNLHVILYGGNVLIYTRCWKLIKLVVSHDSFIPAINVMV